MSFARHFQTVYGMFRDDIFAFCDFIGFVPTWQQRLVLQAVQDATNGRGKVAVKSGQGPGKTACSAVVALWRLLRYVGNLVIVTAPTQRQCTDVFLTEIKARLSSAPVWFQNFFNITKTQVIVAGRRDWCLRTVTATKPENAQGFHRPFGLTVIYEEASGIAREIVEQFRGTMTGEDTLHLQIGNPNTRDSAFFDSFNSQRHNWETITLNSEESPIVDKANLRELEEEFGRDSDVYRVRVLGEFPLSDPNCVISSDDLEKCTTKALYYKCAAIGRKSSTKKWEAIRQFGIDFARFGDDENVVYRRQGNTIVEGRTWAHTEPRLVVDWCFGRQLELGWSDNGTWFVPDAGGMGQGMMIKFQDAGKKFMEFHNGGRAMNAQRYGNRITEAWFEFAKRARKLQVCIPNDPQLIYQLSSRQYKINKDGQFVLEPKDEYKRRTGKPSPDRGDACTMAFYDQVCMPMRMAHKARTRKLGIRLK